MISAISILLVISIVFAAILVFNIFSNNKNMDILADSVSEGGGKFPAFGSSSPKPGIMPNQPKFDFITPETPFSTRHFTVYFDQSGNLIRAHTDAIYSINETQAEYDRMYDLFVRMMVMNHEQGETSYLGLILGSDSLGDFLTQTEHVSRLLAYNKSVMDTLKQTQAELEDERLSLEAKIAIQNETIATLQADMEDLEKQETAILKKMADLEKDQAAAQKEYYANKKLEDELDKELEEYLAELQRKNQAKMESGDWRWPISLNDYQRCTSGFGWRKLYGVWDYHRGWDLAAYRGTTISASKGGKVVIATYHNSYGYYVVIDHGDGVSTVYAHCSKLTVSKGDTVKKGDKIGEVGTTGNSTGNHLHFEFRLNGKFIDPFTYIKNPPIKVIASRYQK